MNVLKPRTKEAVIAIAKWQEGMVEMPTGSNKVKYNTAFYGRPVQGKSYPWCMAFVWWVFKEAGFNLYKNASCTAFVRQYKTFAASQLVYKDFAQGDIVFFDFSGAKKKTEHVGIVVGVSADGRTLTTVEGNTGFSNEANGGAVMVRERSANLITLGVRPNYI